MNKEVRFDIKLTVDGQEVVGKITTSAKQLAQQLGIAKSDSDKLRNSLFLYNGVTQVFDGFTNSVQNVLGVFKDLIAANAEEVVAGAKLANNMRNTMAATDAEVQSIKELCAAQQQLGVIGDEVQLAGAQELATYLTKKQSLEQLIPVMNDMLAQQYGLTASSEQAAQIASMLGKVMDGQVGALSRYGYKFDEAQEQVLKFGTEEQRAAVLTDVVTSAVGGMNAALAQTDAGKAKQMANNMGDLKEKIGALLAPYEELIVKIGNWTMAINQTISVTSSVMGGLKTMRTFLLGIESAAYSCNMAFRAFVVEEKVLGMVSRATGVSLTTLKVAIRGVLIASGVGLAIAALTWALEKLVFSSDEAADGLDGVSDASQRAKEAQEAMTGTYSRAVAEIEGEKQKLQELMKAKADTSGAIQELNNKYGASFGYYKTAKEWYDALIAKSEDYCMQLAYEAQARVLMEQKAANQIKLREILEKRRQMRENGTDKETHSTTVMTNLGATIGGGHTATRYTKEYSDLNTAGWAIVNENKEINQKLKFAADERNKHLKNLGSPTAPTTPTGDVDKKTGKEPLKLIEQPKSLEDLKNNVQYYEQAVSKADKADKEHLKTLVGKLDAAKQLVAAFEQNMEGMSLKLRLEGWQEIDKELRAKGISFDKGAGLEAAATMAVEVQTKMKKDGLIGSDGRLNAKKLLLPEDKLPKIELPEVKDDGFKDAMNSINGLAQSMQNLAGSSKEMAAAMAAVSLAATIANLVATMVEKSRKSLTIWDWIAGIAAGTAAVVSTASQLKGIGAFAQGGIVSGPTMALVGEYAGASNNPEVIAPLDKLRSMIGPQEGISGRVVFKIEGRTLRGVLEREHHHLARS